MAEDGFLKVLLYIADARRVGGSFGTMGSVHVACCVPGICLNCVLTAHESLGEKTDNTYRYVRTK